MILVVNSDKTEIRHKNQVVSCSCVVRNELNRWRNMSQIVYSVPDNLPYMPRVFPTGIWNIGEPREKTDPYMSPYYIPTNAYQMVDEWEIKNGMYVRRSGRKIKDTAYGLHFSTSGTTLGCIKISTEQELLYLVEEIFEALDKKEEIKLIVEG